MVGPAFGLAAAATGGGAAAAGGGGSLLSAGAAKGLATGGAIMSAFGQLQASVGAYYAVQTQRYRLHTQASNLDFMASSADINAQIASDDARAIFDAGRQQMGQTQLGYAQLKARNRAQIAASGLQGGVGSAREVQASVELAKELDTMTIERGTLRAYHAGRMRAVNARNQGLLARTQAGNMRRLAGATSPTLSAVQSLIGGAGDTAIQFGKLGAS